MSNPAPDFGLSNNAPRCPRHPERVAMVRCQRCDRPVCPACQIPAAVGIQCVDCVRNDPQRSPMQSALGAPLRAGKPLVTMTLIGICVVAYIAQVAFRSRAGAGQTCSDALSGLFDGQVVSAHFAFLPGCAAAEPWRFVTSVFLHSSVIHLALNMYALWVVGSFLEQMLGRWRYLALFLISGLGGSTAIALYAVLNGGSLTWFTATVGASGGVFGLFGAMVWVVRRIGANMTGVLSVIGINVIFSFTISQISWQGHLGGLAVGLGLGAIFAFAPAAKRMVYSIAGTAGVTAALIALSAWAAGGGPEHLPRF